MVAARGRIARRRPVTRVTTADLVAAHHQHPGRGVGEQPCDEVRLAASLGVAVQARAGERRDSGEFRSGGPRLHPRRARTAYGDRVDRSPLFLAALASAAVPGLDPASVEALPGAPDHHYDVAFVQDTQHRRWVVRVPRSQAAAAQMESTFGLLALLARRLPFSVPTPKGFAALKEGGRAAIYPYLPGQNVDFAQLPAGPGLAAELGRAIAALHNADHGLFDEAGLPAYDADTYRTRRLSELDRAAATGHVPTGLLARWEKLLEDVTLWRFAPTPDPRRPHRRPGARGLRRRRGRRHRARQGAHRLGGRQGRRPRRRLLRARDPDLPAGPRDPDGGLRARPRRTPRRPPADPGTPVRRDADAVAADVRRHRR